MTPTSRRTPEAPAPNGNGHRAADDREPPRSQGRTEVLGTAADGLREFRRILSNAVIRRWPLYLRNVKQAIRQTEAAFDERAYGFGNLTDLLRAAHREGIVRVDRDRQGVIRVFQGSSVAAPATPGSVEAAPDVASDETAVAAAAAEIGVPLMPVDEDPVDTGSETAEIELGTPRRRQKPQENAAHAHHAHSPLAHDVPRRRPNRTFWHARCSGPARERPRSAQIAGMRGEELACHELRRRGYAILARRYRTRFGEIDIVSECRGTLVFVEVKARRTRRFGGASGAIPFWKRRRLAAMALDYQAGPADSPAAAASTSSPSTVWARIACRST